VFEVVPPSFNFLITIFTSRWNSEGLGEIGADEVAGEGSQRASRL
jgi:hypothetical protein